MSANHLRVLLMPRPPVQGMIENGVDRYLDALVRGMANRVEYVGLDDPQYARGPDKKWEAGAVEGEVKPRFRVTRLIPRNVRLLLGYCRDACRLSRLLRPYRNQVDLIHVNRVGMIDAGMPPCLVLRTSTNFCDSEFPETYQKGLRYNGNNIRRL